MTDPTSRRVRANGLELHLLEWGPANGPMVVFLHGWLDLAWGLAPVASRLADAGFRVVTPDLRGHGDSDRVGAGGHYHLADYLLDLADLMEVTAGADLLVGHSLGGLIASLYAGTYPERIRRLALLEGVGPPAQELARSPAHAADWIATTRWARELRPARYDTLDEVARRLLAVDLRCPPDFARWLARHAARPVDGGYAFKHDLLHLTRGFAPFDLAGVMAFWRRVSSPTLLMDAGQSELKLADRDDRYACFSSAIRLTVQGAGHMLVRHCPDEVAANLIAFLDPAVTR